ncbi:MAG: type II toxin-antitoxin system prevent-host-death family antitoxin [Actinobacteria bacterium]|nr:type II toxin-antitoxin system prevent-host-death family antitoxin [Actinomycetota bacterium]
MRRLGIRELRNNARQAVRRAMAGERIVITVSGVPAAQLGPLNAGTDEATLDDLVAAGLLRGRAASSPRVPQPLRAPGVTTTTEILREHRDR